MKKTIFILGLLPLFLGTAFSQSLVDVEWLKDKIGDDGLVILDVRSAITNEGNEQFVEGHIPGATFSDYLKESWRIKLNGVVGMLPPNDVLSQMLRRFGIEEDSTIVIVGGGQNAVDFGSAARVFWTLKSVHLKNIHILNGGYRAWKRASKTNPKHYPIETGDTETVFPSDITVTFDDRYLAKYDDVRKNLNNENYILVDARPGNFYIGDKKHDEAKTAGTLPGAQNIKYFTFYDEKIGRFVDKKSALKRVDELNINDKKTVVTFCNSGHWAAVVWFGLNEVAGIESKMYDGSMVEWTQNPENPVHTPGMVKKIWLTFVNIFDKT